MSLKLFFIFHLLGCISSNEQESPRKDWQLWKQLLESLKPIQNLQHFDYQDCAGHTEMLGVKLLLCCLILPNQVHKMGV